MKKLLLLFVSMFVVNTGPSSLSAGEIDWKTNFEEATTVSKEQSKPMALFFTGSDWCTWCHRLEDEALNTPEFAEVAADKFVFVKLDYPMKAKQSEEMIKQNKDLQQKYDIKSFPTILILTPDQREIGMTGYRPGGGAQYGKHLLSITKEYIAYDTLMQELGKNTLTGTELKSLYHQAQGFNLNDDEVKIVLEGMKSDRPQYFMIERYRQLANEGCVREKEATEIRANILESDPTNRYLSHYQVACIDFDAFADEMNMGKATTDDAVSPLIDYMNKFGDKDSQNLWRINMIISQVYQDKNDHQKALKYAESAYHSAPADTKQDIAMAIETIKANRN